MLKKYFIRRAKSIFLVMIIPTFILFLVVGFFFISYQNKSLEEKGPETLQIFEESLEASLYNMGYQIDAMMSNSSFSLALRNLLDHTAMQRNDLMVFDMLKYLFNSYETSYSYIHSVYLYLDDRERFLTSESGQIANVNTYYDQEWYQEYKNMDSDDLIYTSKRWLQRYAYDEPVEVISLYYRATYLDGVIVINVDKSEYGKLLRNVLISDNQTVFLFNSKGDIICTTDNDFQNIGQDQRFMDTIRNHIVSGQYQELSNKWTRIYGKLYYLTIQYSEYADLYQVSAISIKQMFYELNYYLLMALTILILDIAVMFILAYTYTKRSFSYIEECINIFSAAERGEKIDNKFIKEQDEYGILMNNIIFLYIENNKMQMDLREREHENEITEMAALQLQINPHFIFNTLQIMDLEIIKVLGNQSGLHKIVQQLSLVVKYALTNPTEEVKLKKEIDYLKTYLEIQNMRFEGGGIIYFEVDETILETKVFRLILQPMLENCFEHGMRIEKQHLLIKVKIFDQGDYIHFAVVDNGRGMSREEISELYMKINNKESKNIGLTNLNRRLLLHYGKESALKIQSKEGQGTIISFKVPKQNSNK